MWVNRTADSTLFTCWPPAPPERSVSIFRSDSLILMSTLSSISGETNTEANDVWRRLLASNGEIRTSRWTPRFRLEVAVRMVARQEEGGALDPRLVAVLPLDELHGVPVPVREPGVHPEEHLGPVLGLRAAGPGVDRRDGVQRVVLAGEHPLEFDRVQRLVDGDDLLLDLGGQPLAARLSGEVEIRLQVRQGGFKGRPAPEERLDRLPLPKDALGRLRGVPETVARDLGRQAP